MPQILNANAIYKGDQPIQQVMAQGQMVWPEAPPMSWKPLVTFNPFKWFHDNAARVPNWYPPGDADGSTCTFDRASDTMTINFPTPFEGSFVGWSGLVYWPGGGGMAHPHPLDPTGLKVQLDATWSGTEALIDTLSYGWCYWSEDGSAETTTQWGEWKLRGFFPTRLEDPSTPVRPPAAGGWVLALTSLMPGQQVPAGHIKLKSPTVTLFEWA